MSEQSARSGRHVAQPPLLSVRRWRWVARRTRASRNGAGRRRLGAPTEERSGVVRGLVLPIAAVGGIPIGAGPALAVADLPTVIGNATHWLVGILATLATFFLTLGGARYLTAGGDPAEVEKAKTALKSAGIGYALALLAPVILQILQQILGVGQ